MEFGGDNDWVRILGAVHIRISQSDLGCRAVAHLDRSGLTRHCAAQQCALMVHDTPSVFEFRFFK
jgi:hypothetical protein